VKVSKSTQEAADAIGITAQSLGTWATRPGAPVQTAKNGTRRFFWPDFPRWREQQLLKTEREAAKPKTLADAEDRYESARALKMEMEVAELSGELVRAEDAAEEVDKMLAQLRAQLLTLPQRHAPGLVGCKTIPEVSAKLEAAIREALEALSGDD
jgi:DNA-binding transcriptional MerR regulator